MGTDTGKYWTLTSLLITAVGSTLYVVWMYVMSGCKMTNQSTSNLYRWIGHGNSSLISTHLLYHSLCAYLPRATTKSEVKNQVAVVTVQIYFSASGIESVWTTKLMAQPHPIHCLFVQRGMRAVDYAETSGTKDTVKVLHSAALVSQVCVCVCE